MSKTKYIAPDGGWGWVIVVAFALNNIVTIPILQGFGMVYGSSFRQLGVSATQSSIIININQAFGMILGMMNGPLLRTLGYRKMAIVGALLYSLGIISTSFANSFASFVICYGMMASLGMSIAMSSTSLAVNTYFKEKRGRAMGWAMTITGLGPIFVPQLTSILLASYHSEGTMLILGGMSLHALVGALLLQPIKWHAKPVEEDVQNDASKKVDFENETTKEGIIQETASLLGGSNEKVISDVETGNKKGIRKISRTITNASADVEDDNISIYGFETPISVQNGSLLDLRGDWNADNQDSNLESKTNGENKKFPSNLSSGALEDFEYKRSNSFDFKRNNSCESRSRKLSVSSAKYTELALSRNVLFECPEEDGEDAKSGNDEKSGKDDKIDLPKPEPMEPPTKPNDLEVPRPQSSLMHRLFTRIVLFFDLDLLRDPIYVNIMLGMSIAIFAEFNFSVLTPFILHDMHLKTDGIAMMMSVIATSDLMLRAAAPYIGEYLRKSPRVMYIVSLVMLILTRSALLFAKTYYSIMFVAFGLGIAKGVRTVYMTLVIPSYVPLERLPNASSIQSLVNGTLLMIAGPILGVLRDITGSYASCIVFINSVTAITVIMWLTEFAYIHIKKRRKLRTTEALDEDLKKVESR